MFSLYIKLGSNIKNSSFHGSFNQIVQIAFAESVSLTFIPIRPNTMNNESRGGGE
jgi:hypothetical protein